MVGSINFRRLYLISSNNGDRALAQMAHYYEVIAVVDVLDAQHGNG